MTSYLMNSKNIIIQLTRQTFILLLIVKIQLGLQYIKVNGLLGYSFTQLFNYILTNDAMMRVDLQIFSRHFSLIQEKLLFTVNVVVFRKWSL